MAYTFGGATSDDVTDGSLSSNIGASLTHVLVTGWFYPTTLTAGRGLWSASTVIGAEVAAATNEIVLRTDNTTDGQWTTTGAGLTVDQWTFLAFLNSCNNSGPAAAWRVWSGTVEAPPVECSVAQDTAPVGNFAGSNNFTIGNKGTGTVAFQGDIESVIVGQHTSSFTVDKTQNVLPIETAGTITQAEADMIYQRLVWPIWNGEIAPPGVFGGLNAARAALNWFWYPLIAPVNTHALHHKPASTTQGPRQITNSGPAYSAQRGPRPYIGANGFGFPPLSHR